MSHQTIAFLGPNGTFAHLAAQTRYGTDNQLVPCSSIKEVFDYVADHNSSLGIVPIENSSGGTIKDTVDCLVEHAYDGLSIHESLAVKVNLALLGKSRENLRVIYSHFAPLHHCHTWLDEHFPKVKREEVSSTAAAVKHATKGKGVAAIGNRMAGEMYGLKVLEYPLKTDVENVTQFFVLGHPGAPPVTKSCRTTVVATLPNTPGGLVDFLTPFKREGINLTRIISRPIVGKPEAYSFLVDIKGSLSDEQVKKALAQAKKYSRSLRSLGTYPVRKRYES